MSELCKYCGGGWNPLYRIIDSYPYDEYIIDESECEMCFPKPCDEDCSGLVCENRIVMQNKLNLTIAIVGERLMFEDKTKCPRKG